MSQRKLAFSMIWLMEIKGLPRRMVSDKVLCDQALNFAKNPKHDIKQIFLQ